MAQLASAASSSATDPGPGAEPSTRHISSSSVTRLTVAWIAAIQGGAKLLSHNLTPGAMRRGDGTWSFNFNQSRSQALPLYQYFV